MTYPVFAAGDVLAASDMNAVGLWKINTFTASGTNRALVCDNVFTTDYDHYRVVLQMRSTVNTNGFFFQYIDTAGTTVALNYYSSAYGQDFTSGATGFTGVLNGTTIVYVGWIPNSTTATISASMDIYNPRSSSLITNVNGQQSGVASGASYFGGNFYSMTTVTTAFRGIRFDNGGAGNLTGTVRVYGYTN